LDAKEEAALFERVTTGATLLPSNLTPRQVTVTAFQIFEKHCRKAYIAPKLQSEKSGF